MSEKTRIAVTVSKSLADQVKADIRTLNLPPATLSNLVNEWLVNFAPVLRQMADKKSKGEQLSFEEVIGNVLETTGRGMKS